jgi:NADH-quinone oxidoreductase subunit J
MESHGLFYQVQFYVFGLIAVMAALLFVTRRSPVAAALWLVTTMFALAALYIMLDAQFIGAIQVLVYAGAIMVVFLFVVMLLNLGQPAGVADLRGQWGRVAGGLVGLVLFAELFVLLRQRLPRIPPAPAQPTGVINSVAQPLFNEYLVAFEATSVLLLAAIVGAVVLAKRRV